MSSNALMDRWLSPLQVYELTGIKPRTLQAMRYEGRGPRYTKTHPGRTGRVRYRHSDVIAWMEANAQGGDTDAG